jgi:putative transposase
VDLTVERALVKLLVERGLSERRACAGLGVNRASARYEAKAEDATNALLREKLRELAQENRRYGSPRMAALLHDLYGVNHKRIERLWQEEGLPLPRKIHRRKEGMPMWLRPQEATRPNDVWCFDFVFDRTQYGQKLKMFTIVDEFTRECLEIRVEKRMTHQEVLEILDELIFERGKPKFVRCDNGAEFVAGELRQWLREQGIGQVNIDPGSPWQNGYIESFNGKFRDECLNQEIFFSRGEAQVIVDRFREQYNTKRPHSSLGYKTPLAVLTAHNVQATASFDGRTNE